MTNLSKHNYYKGETVSPENLNASFEYPDKIRDSLVNELLGYGIIEGFDVTQSNNLELKVNPGLAYNQSGERLTLNEEKTVNINNLLPTSGTKTVVLGVKRDFLKTDPATDTEGNVIYTTWTPTVAITVDTKLSGEYFTLASITLNSQGITEITQNSPKFQNLPLLDHRTKHLSSGDNSSTLQAEILKVLANEHLSLQGNLINLVTQNLQVNGRPYIETGSNGNGIYFKFANGLLLCWKSGCNYNVVFPIAFSSPPTLTVNAETNFAYPGHDLGVWNYRVSCYPVNVSNTGCSIFVQLYITDRPTSFRDGSGTYIAIGFWK